MKLTRKHMVPLIVVGVIVLLLGFLAFFNSEITNVGNPIDLGEFDVEFGDNLGYCGNLMIDEGEDCDDSSMPNGVYCTDFDYEGPDFTNGPVSFTNGVLGCTASCTFDVSQCIVDIVGEYCSPQGSLSPYNCDACGNNNACNLSVSHPSNTFVYNSCPFCDSPLPICGNNALDSEEYCDETPLGVEWGILQPTCQAEGFDGGVVGCSNDCQIDTSSCTNIEEICDNNIDDDGNGETDCDDYTCENGPICNPPLPQEVLDNMNCGSGEYCKVITTDYDLNIDISTTRHGILINASGITLDCHGNTILRTGGSQKDGLTIVNQDDVTVQNCIFEHFNDGLVTNGMTESTILNNQFLDNLWRGARIQLSDNNDFIQNIVVGDDVNNRGWFMSDSSDNLVSLNEISSFTLEGLRVQDGNNNTIENNIVQNVGNDGISLVRANSNNVFSNDVFNIGDEGIQLWFSHTNTISQNTVTNTVDDLILAQNSNENIIDSNTISFGPFEGIQLKNASFNTISNNNISDITFEAIEVVTGSNNIISDNIITSSLGGIQLNSTTNNEIYSNDLCGLAQSFTCIGFPDTGNNGSYNFADGVDFCDDGTPSNAFYSCFESSQSTCNDQVDNDGDGLTDCQDLACNGQPCGTNQACNNELCEEVTDAPPIATVPLVAAQFKFIDYAQLFTFLNSGEVIEEIGVCNDICEARGQVCGFAQAGQKTCEEVSDKCTCYTFG